MEKTKVDQRRPGRVPCSECVFLGPYIGELSIWRYCQRLAPAAPPALQPGWPSVRAEWDGCGEGARK